MTVKQSKSIDRLYREVGDYDLVIVPDSPLADALNRRLERPHFGPFAITPRRLATRRREVAEDRTAFLEVIDETDLGWKEIAYTVGNVLQCWEYRGSAEAILEYDAFDTPATRTVVDIVSSLQTSSRLLEDYEIDVDEHGDLFTGYVAALATAVNEHVVSNPRLVERVDDIYRETLVASR